ncbi:MAG: prolipoprotein diacylglyceryl transferase [Moorellales bacterium]
MLLELDPYVFRLGSFGVRWYGLFMAVCFLIGTWYLLREGRRRGWSEDFLLNLALVAIVAGVVGARLLFVAANYPRWFVAEPLHVLRVWEGGLAWHGGLGGGFLAAWLYARSRGISIHALADLAVPGVTLGYAAIRVANIFNQEVLGRPTAFGFGRWPAQPIAMALALILLLRYFYLARRNPPAGYQFWSFVFYHQLLRGVVEESIRDMPLVLWGQVWEAWGVGLFTLAQVATPAVMLLAYYFMRRSRRGEFEN